MSDFPDGYGSVNASHVSSFLTQAYECEFYWGQYSIPAAKYSNLTLYNSYEQYVYQLLGYRIMSIDDVALHAFLYRGVRSEGYVKVKCQYEFFYPPGYNVYLVHDDYYNINVFNPLAGAHIVNVTYFYNKFVKPTGWVVRPRASLAVDDPTPAVGQNLQFTDTSTGSPDQWSWQFGDGSLSTLQNPTHAYAAAGTYTVSLAVHNIAGWAYYHASITVT